MEAAGSGGVVLDYELKRDCQRSLHERSRSPPEHHSDR